MFTLIDLSCAKDVKERPDLYPFWFQDWANKVINFFDTLFALARAYYRKLKNWALSVKAVYQTLRKYGGNILKASAEYCRELRQTRFANFPSDYLGDKVARTGIIRTRAKFPRMVKMRNKTDAMQSYL